MPRALSDYTPRDWLRFRPALEALRQWRIRRATDAFALRPPRVGDLGSLQTAIRGREAMATIAFNDPEFLARQIRAVQTFVPGAVHLIADNSDDDLRAADIGALCAATGAPYLRLPANPWGPRSPSRSHGAAMNWVWRRLFRPARPRAFGFLDHDILPLEPDDPFEPLIRQPVAGDKRWSGSRWYLWAGYCFFRIEVFDSLEPDFGQDWSIGLDTGGANWRRLYSGIDPSLISERPIQQIPIFPDLPPSDCFYERRGAWLHEVGFRGRRDLADAKRPRVLEIVDAALAAAPGRSNRPGPV